MSVISQTILCEFILADKERRSATFPHYFGHGAPERLREKNSEEVEEDGCKDELGAGGEEVEQSWGEHLVLRLFYWGTFYSDFGSTFFIATFLWGISYTWGHYLMGLFFWWDLESTILRGLFSYLESTWSNQREGQLSYHAISGIWGNITG